MPVPGTTIEFRDLARAPGGDRSISQRISTNLSAGRDLALHEVMARRSLLIADDTGSALLEALTAAAVIVTVSTGVALLVVTSTRAIWNAGVASTAVIAARQKLEQLAALEWRTDSAGLRRSDQSSDLSADPPVSSGSGLQPSPSGSLDRNIPGFVDFLGRDGQWRGRGSAPVPGTAFVRRWSISAHPGDPADTLTLTVVVLPVLDAARGSLHPSAVRLQTIRTRTAR